MTLLNRRREEIARERNAQEQPPARRSVAVRPPQPRPSFLHVQSAIGNHAVGSWLRASAAPVVGGDGPAMESRPRGGDAHDLVASELQPMLRLAGLLNEPRQAARLSNALLVPDGGAAADGQMTRSAFLAAMRDAAAAAAEGGLAGSGHTARGCPWIEHYFHYYQQQNAARIEADLLRHLPAARTAANAEQLLVLAAEHVGASVRHWAASGELVGVPRDLPGAGLVASIQAQLGRGRPLPASARSRMERAFGARFAGVRLHTDAVASRLARRLRTRAFAVGPHVAFDRGEYRPGTVVGDAVLAHELAHTLQQRGAEHASPRAATSTPRVENAADSAAAGVLARLWGGGRTLVQRLASRPVHPLRSGLALASCREVFSEDELRKYLDHLEQHGPEKGIQDDNRARDVVRKNRKRPGTFAPTDKQVLGMVEDMLAGSTGEDDQNAIFELLDESKAARLQFLFTQGLTSKRLRDKLSGDRKKKLEAFFAQRFEGGAQALDAGTVRPVPDADLVEHSLRETIDKPGDRGFRPEDLANLKQQGKSLTFSGGLSPLPGELERLLLDNIAATVSFALDPTNPIRQAEVKAVQQEIAAQPPGPMTPFKDLQKPAERVDATDLYHGHVCVPRPLLAKSAPLKELQKKTFFFHGTGGHGGRTIAKDIADAQGRADIGTTETPRTLPMARTIVGAVEKNRARFLEALELVLEALKTVPEAGVEYHSYELARPGVGISGAMSGDHPLRNIFTPFSTSQPALLRVGHPHCEALLNFSFHVNRRGEITLLPGADYNMVFAYELLYGFDEGPPPAAPAKPSQPQPNQTPPPGGKP